MSERDVIAAVIQAGRYGGRVFPADSPMDYRQADKIVAALRESRTVRTVEQLDALPDGTIILDDVGDPLTRRGSRWWSIDHHDEDREAEIGQWSSLAVFTPGKCLILWNPDEEGAR